MILLKALLVLLPWRIRRLALIKLFGYDLHPKSRIGFSYIYPDHLVMHEGASIASLVIAVHVENMELSEYSSIGRGSWVTGVPKSERSKRYLHQPGRVSKLYLGTHSDVVKNHHLDCTHSIIIGNFTIIAGYQSQFLTHSVNLEKCIQDSNPIEIGDYCFVGTNSVVLGGAFLPSKCVLGAKSLLNKNFQSEYMMYGGVPAKPVVEIPESSLFFHRKSGFIL